MSNNFLSEDVNLAEELLNFFKESRKAYSLLEQRLLIVENSLIDINFTIRKINLSQSETQIKSSSNGSYA